MNLLKAVAVNPVPIVFAIVDLIIGLWAGFFGTKGFFKTVPKVIVRAVVVAPVGRCSSASTHPRGQPVVSGGVAVSAEPAGAGRRERRASTPKASRPSAPIKAATPCHPYRLKKSPPTVPQMLEPR